MDANERVLALDPGNEQTAWLIYQCGRPVGFGTSPNETVLEWLRDEVIFGNHLAVEMVASYGMPVGREVFDTCVWIGRFIQASPVPHTHVYRKDVKLHLCGQTRAKDANVRQALLDRFGPGKEKAVGRKSSPGPLYGIKADEWSALAVAVTFADTHLLARLQQGTSNE